MNRDTGWTVRAKCGSRRDKTLTGRDSGANRLKDREEIGTVQTTRVQLYRDMIVRDSGRVKRVWRHSPSRL